MKDPQDAIVSVTFSVICGTDLHIVRGPLAGMNSTNIPIKTLTKD